jgi:ribonuclease HII
VILPENFPQEVLDDSKKLSPKKRDEAATLIKTLAPFWGVGWATHVEIDDINILQASLLAMSRAFADMTGRMEGTLSGLERIVVDGLHRPQLAGLRPGTELIAMPRADAQVPAVMAASILAKTERDREMFRLDQLYPQYAYAKHKGYPTQEHAALIARFGPSPIQRKTFRVPGIRPPA